MTSLTRTLTRLLYPGGPALWIPVLAIIFRLGSSTTASLCYFLLAFYALHGRVQAIQALMLSWLFSMLSSGIAPGVPMAAVGRYAVVFAAAASVLTFSRSWRNSATQMTFFLGLFLVLHSLLFSPVVDVSVLKATSWMVVMVTLIAAWGGLADEVRSRLVDQVFAVLTLLMLLSIPLLVLPLGYLTSGTGFQGVFSHPQSFGPAMALLCAWGVGQMLSQRRPTWSSVALVGMCLSMVALSEARTAGVALVLGVGVAIMMVTGFRRGHGMVLPGLRSARFQFVVVFSVLGLIVAAASVNRFITDFIAKGDQAEVSGLLGAYEDSRGPLMEKMWANIEKDSWVGIGFGIASNHEEMAVARDPLLGLPVSASIEKGVLPLAVLEEVGVIGFALTALWILMLFKRTTRGGITPTAVSVTALLLNMGESTLFSPSGFGLLPLILLGWAFSTTSRPRA